jgi:hydroxymethylglutaryl-CoA synthase
MTYFDRDIEKAFMTVSKAAFEAKTKPSLLVATSIGNMYTPSLYGGLVSYLVTFLYINLFVCLFNYFNKKIRTFLILNRGQN